MRSEKQIQASRTNGARSGGPITAQGKRNSSRNNLRHGFSARDSSLDHNPPPAFTALKAEYMADFQPTTAHEIHLVHTMAVASWRTSLVRAAEKRALDKAIARQKVKSADPLRLGQLALEDSPECRALLRYQVAFHLQFQRSLKRLTLGPRVHRKSKETPSHFEPRKSLNLKGPLQKQNPPLGFQRPISSAVGQVPDLPRETFGLSGRQPAPRASSTPWQKIRLRVNASI
jgi:hypothetical protein